MKKPLLLIAILFTLTAKAQTNVYHSFPDSNAVWNEEYDLDFSLVCNVPLHQQYSYTIIGDTIISAFTYHKIYTPYVENFGDTTNCSGIHLAGYKGCIRQDTLNRKVYFISPNENIEKLLYDFSLQVGDTVKNFAPWGCSEYGLTVYAIDSILIQSSYRKLWVVGTPGMIVVPDIIEGIGYGSGLLDVLCNDPLGWNQRLLCFQQNGQTLFPDTTTQCAIIDAVKNIPKKNISVNSSPNPFHSSSLLQVSSEFVNAKLNIYNSLGAIVREEGMLNQETFVLKRNELHNGIYFMQLINDRGQMITEKLIVE